MAAGVQGGPAQSRAMEREDTGPHAPNGQSGVQAAVRRDWLRSACLLTDITGQGLHDGIQALHDAVVWAPTLLPHPVCQPAT